MLPILIGMAVATLATRNDRAHPRGLPVAAESFRRAIAPEAGMRAPPRAVNRIRPQLMTPPSLIADLPAMPPGEFLTRATIWLALGGYACGAGALLAARDRARWLRRARWAWTLGCACFLAHVVCAFSFFHGWSHAEAYRETARQTAELTGLRWGGGLFLNYLLTVAWVADVGRWWLRSAECALRPAWLAALWHGFFFFLVFNGTVVFGRGPVRWLGFAICALLGVLWWRRSRPAVTASGSG